jgi:hypothetical protein
MVIGFIGVLKFVTTSNYSSIVHSDKLQFLGCLIVLHGRNCWPFTTSSVWPPLATTHYSRLALNSDSELVCLFYLLCPQLQWIEARPRRHNRSWFRAPSDPWQYFGSLQTSTCFEMGSTFSTRGGVWLLVTPLLLESTLLAVTLTDSLRLSSLKPVLSWSQSQSYVMIDGQSASLSWCQAPIWGLRRDFYYCQTVACLLMWGALSDERTGLPFTIAAGPSPAEFVTIFYSPNLEGQVPVFISPRNRVAQLYPQAMGSLFITSYDSQG